MALARLSAIFILILYLKVISFVTIFKAILFICTTQQTYKAFERGTERLQIAVLLLNSYFFQKTM